MVERAKGAETGMPDYPIPAGRHRVETVVRRSRFIATLAPAPDPAFAQELVRDARVEFPDATHHCWAFVAGPPGSTSHIGMSDDGEPHGTAGRPMLHVLLHSGVGEVAAVVTRYYGGVKLGTGGLARAYTDAVSAALESLPLDRRTPLASLRIQAPFSAMDPVFRLLEEMGGREREDRYAEGIDLLVKVPVGIVDAVRAAVAEVTSGAGVVEEIEG